MLGVEAVASGILVVFGFQRVLEYLREPCPEPFLSERKESSHCSGMDGEVIQGLMTTRGNIAGRER